MYTEGMENTKATASPYTAQKMLGIAKNFTGYTLALAIVVWGFTFALMQVWLVVASLLVAMVLGAGVFLMLTAKLVVSGNPEALSE